MQLFSVSDITVFTIDQPYMKMIALLVILYSILKSSVYISIAYREKADCVTMSFNNETPFILKEYCIASLN